MLQRFFDSAQPAHLQARLFRRAQAKMQAEIVLRAKTSAASHLLYLAAVVRLQNHTGADGGTIGSCSNQLHQQPRVGWRRLVAKQGRRIVQVVDRDGDASGVEDIAKGRTPAAPGVSESRPS